MFKQDENPLCICYSTQKSDIGTVVGLGNIIEMAAMPFPCNCHLLCCVNISTVLLMFFSKFASCSIPYFNK